MVFSWTREDLKQFRFYGLFLELIQEIHRRKKNTVQNPTCQISVHGIEYRDNPVVSLYLA